MKRQVSYQWRLREMMAAHGMFNATDLAAPLADRGIKLSSVQIWRLVTQTPERLSMPVLAALCDIFECTPDKLIATKAENVSGRRTSAGGQPAQAAVDLAAIRPKRARIRPDAE
jgi:DNA-binding Xre family transcriptional regulator